MSTGTLSPADFAVRRMGYAVNPWRVVHVPTDQAVTIPKALRNADGRTVPYTGPASFPRKRDALAWLRDELPALVAAYNATTPTPTRAPRREETSR